jgi:hypothetical protein
MDNSSLIACKYGVRVDTLSGFGSRRAAKINLAKFTFLVISASWQIIRRLHANEKEIVSSAWRRTIHLRIYDTVRER